VSLALARNTGLVLTRGYGRASVVGNVAVEPTTPATIMSVSKPITAKAALMPVRDGKLQLNDRALELLRAARSPGRPNRSINGSTRSKLVI
jgi:CubicO group peptidase (beta-lactamase class C family)